MKLLGLIAVAAVAITSYAGFREMNVSAGGVSPIPADDLVIDLRTDRPDEVVRSFLRAIRADSVEDTKRFVSLSPPGFRESCQAGEAVPRTAEEVAVERELDRRVYELLGSTTEYLRNVKPEFGEVQVERMRSGEAVVSVAASIGENLRPMTFYLTARGKSWAIFHIDAVPVREPAFASFATQRPYCGAG